MKFRLCFHFGTFPSVVDQCAPIAIVMLAMRMVNAIVSGKKHESEQRRTSDNKPLHSLTANSVSFCGRLGTVTIPTIPIEAIDTQSRSLCATSLAGAVRNCTSQTCRPLMISRRSCIGLSLSRERERLLKHGLNQVVGVIKCKGSLVSDGRLSRRRSAIGNVNHKRHVTPGLATKKSWASGKVLGDVSRSGPWDRGERVRGREEGCAVLGCLK